MPNSLNYHFNPLELDDNPTCLIYLRLLRSIIKITAHTIVIIVARIVSSTACSPEPRIIGMGPIKRNRLMEFFKPESKAVKNMISTPIKINKNPRKNIFMGRVSNTVISLALSGDLEDFSILPEHLRQSNS